MLTAQVKRAQHTQNELNENMTALRAKQRHLADDLERIKREMHTVYTDRKREEDDRTKVEEVLKRTQAQANNRLAAFGNSMPNIVRDIQNERRFRGPVLGPFGTYIQLNDPKWATTLESVIGRALGDFAVSNFHDQALLTSIIKRHGTGIRIHVTDFDLFDYTRGEPSSDLLTVLRVLQFTDDRIKCIMINQATIEKIVLIADYDEAQRTMRGGYPPNVIACYTEDFVLVGSKSGAKTMNARQKYTGTPRLTRDITSVILRC
jgi:chromosome segregation ATPase